MHGIRTKTEDELVKLTRKARAKGADATKRACLAELQRRAKANQATILNPDGSHFSGPRMAA